MDSGLQRVLKGGLWGLYALVPLVVFYRTYHPTEIKDLLFVGVVALLALGWLKLSMEQEGQVIELSGLNWILLANAVVWALSALLSPFPGESLQPISVRLAGVGLVLLAPALLTRRQDLSLVVGLLLGAVSVMSLYGLLQFLRLDPFLRTAGLLGHFRVSSTTDHPNIFVSVLVAAVPLNIAAFRLFGGRGWRLPLLALSLVVNVAAAIATLSRGGWAALAAAVAITLVGLRLTRPRAAESPAAEATTGSWGWGVKVVVPLVAAVAVVLLAVGLGKGSLDPGERQRLLDLRGPTVAKRLMIYRGALKMAADSPVIGQGLGTFALFLPGYRSPELARFFPRNEYHVEHGVSEPLEVLAESGALGLIVWLLLVGVLVVRPLRAAPRIADPGLRTLAVAAAAGTAGLVLHGLVEVNLRFQPPQFLFWALPALALAACGAEGGPGTARRVTVAGWPGRLGIGALVGMVFGLAFAMTLSNFVASYHVASGRRALKQDQLARAERAFRAAEAAWAGNLPARYRRALVLWKLGHLGEAEAEYREVIRRSPYYFDVNHNLARVLFEQGKLDQADRWADVAIRINPYHVPSYELAVRIALKQGRLAEAQRAAEHIVKAAGHDTRSHVALARVRVAQGKLAEARQVLEQALRRDPKSKEARYLLERVKARPSQ
jgi:O-antigen ligase/Tfp pilus assembly protein PilF